jgi:hypothetical protein
MTMTNRPDLDDLIAEAAKLPPGLEAWRDIFDHYPELSVEELAEKFRKLGERAQYEADELQRYARNRQKPSEVIHFPGSGGNV